MRGRADGAARFGDRIGFRGDPRPAIERATQARIEQGRMRANERLATGRIDKAVELTYMELADKKRMAKRILGDYPDEYLTMLEFIDKYPDMQETPAQFQERCGQIALKCFWREQQGGERELSPAKREMPYNEPSPEEILECERCWSLAD